MEWVDEAAELQNDEIGSEVENSIQSPSDDDESDITPEYHYEIRIWDANTELFERL